MTDSTARRNLARLVENRDIGMSERITVREALTALDALTAENERLSFENNELHNECDLSDEQIATLDALTAENGRISQLCGEQLIRIETGRRNIENLNAENEEFPPVPTQLLWMFDAIDRKEATKMMHDYARLNAALQQEREKFQLGRSQGRDRRHRMIPTIDEMNMALTDIRKVVNDVYDGELGMMGALAAIRDLADFDGQSQQIATLTAEVASKDAALQVAYDTACELIDKWQAARLALNPTVKEG